MHEAAFELIEIPHVSYSGKNSADIRLVVDALDLCYTKEHVHIFVIVSGDSDFSPLVSKLRENNKTVIGLGVKNSSAELLIDNCDQFIFYDDLVRPRTAGTERPRGRRRGGDRDGRSDRGGDKPAEKPVEKPVAERPAPEKVEAPAAAVETESVETLRLQAIERVLDTVDSLFRERDDNLWGSMVKQTIKRKQPQFAETFHGYRNFNRLLEDMRDRGLLEIQKEEKSGGYLILGFGPEA
ncbi:MAG: NYN domain-containing protein [bacterium]